MIISLIRGNGFTKAVLDPNRKTGKVCSFPSIVGNLQSSIGDSDLSEFGLSSGALILNGETFVYGENARKFSRLAVSSMSEESIASDNARKLWAAALFELLGATDATPDILITTLPITWYKDTGQREQFKHAMSGDYNLVANGKAFTYTLNAEAIKVIPEGLPTLTNAIYNDWGDPIHPEYAETRVGIVNIGTVTTDLTMLDTQQPVPAYCTALEVGLSNVWEYVIERAQSEYGMRIQAHEADRAIQEGVLYVGKKPVTDVVTWADTQAKQVAASIQQQIDRTDFWQAGRAVRVMIPSGGGAITIGKHLFHRYVDTVHLVQEDLTQASAAMAEAYGAWIFASIKTRSKA